jgi:hypothetical protein
LKIILKIKKFLPYSSWTAFVKIICNPQSNKTIHFDKGQEVQRKDVEQAFGVLQLFEDLLYFGTKRLCGALRQYA